MVAKHTRRSCSERSPFCPFPSEDTPLLADLPARRLPSVAVYLTASAMAGGDGRQVNEQHHRRGGNGMKGGRECILNKRQRTLLASGAFVLQPHAARCTCNVCCGLRSVSRSIVSPLWEVYISETHTSPSLFMSTAALKTSGNKYASEFPKTTRTHCFSCCATNLIVYRHGG